jgi:hypothetical protein
MRYTKGPHAKGTQIAIIDPEGVVIGVYELDEVGEADALLEKLNRTKEQEASDANERG